MSKKVWEISKIGKHENDLLGQREVFGVVTWNGTISFDESQQIGRPNHWSSF